MKVPECMLLHHEACLCHRDYSSTHWVQEQSAHGLAPNFGDAEEPVIARAQNGVLYEAEAEGTATYMVVLSLRYTKTYESEDFA